METKHLIELNNEKRKQLTEENERYYSDLLLYIRLQFRISEQAGEEILMELLDHLLEGQKEGKTAREIFGDDPKAYADEIIGQLPKEKFRQTVPFITELVLNILGWFLIIRGGVLFIAKQFKDVSESFYAIPFVFIAVVSFLTIGFMVSFIFKTIKDSLFIKEKKKWRDSLKVGAMAVVSMGIVIGTAYLMPKFGPVFHFPWYASLIAGGLFWAVSKIMGKVRK